MPYNRPSAGVYVTNGGTALTHGQAVVNGKFVGVAVKQRTRSWKDGYSLQRTIDAAEPYYIIDHGTVQVDAGATLLGQTPVVGDAVYIDSSNVLTKTNTANTPYGRIVELAGQRGTPTGKVRIDLDTKSAVAAAAF